MANPSHPARFRPHAPPPFTSQPIRIEDYLPSFSEQHIPLVYIENIRFDAKRFHYEIPFVILGKSGFVVDYGDRIGYFASTWQGLPNPSFQFQDLKLIYEIAISRFANEENYDEHQLGLWREWQIGGSDGQLVQRFEKQLSLFPILR